MSEQPSLRRRMAVGSLATVAAAAVAVAVTSAGSAGAATTPSYTNYAAPSNLKGANDAGEPSIGSNWGSRLVAEVSVELTSDQFALGVVAASKETR